MTHSEIAGAVENRDKIKELVAIVDSIPQSSKYNSTVNYDAITAIRKILGIHSNWAALGDKTRLKRELRKRNFTI